ncbi:hypothetical protein BJY52DRAFT_1268517 [Lactarius psammicola]|nr:hypothetical protein BJY52DRAFT_1268517 [Lactarius psammicola]
MTPSVWTKSIMMSVPETARWEYTIEVSADTGGGENGGGRLFEVIKKLDQPALPSTKMAKLHAKPLLPHHRFLPMPLHSSRCLPTIPTLFPASPSVACEGQTSSPCPPTPAIRFPVPPPFLPSSPTLGSPSPARLLLALPPYSPLAPLPAPPPPSPCRRLLAIPAVCLPCTPPSLRRMVEVAPTDHRGLLTCI